MTLLGSIKYLELVTVLIATAYYQKFFNSYLKYFLFLMWFVTVVEFVIAGLKFFDMGFQNQFVYNIVTSIQFVYYFSLYHKTIKTARYKKWIQYFLSVFTASVVVNFLFFQKLTITAPFHSYTYTLGAILLIITIGLFLTEILNSEKILFFQRYLMFWISIGLLLFHTGIIPFIISFNFFPAMLSSDSLSIIFFTLNFVMYSCLTIGFAWSQKYSD
jgi:hypothetical protein